MNHNVNHPLAILSPPYEPPSHRSRLERRRDAAGHALPSIVGRCLRRALRGAQRGATAQPVGWPVAVAWHGIFIGFDGNFLIRTFKVVDDG